MFLLIFFFTAPTKYFVSYHFVYLHVQVNSGTAYKEEEEEEDFATTRAVASVDTSDQSLPATLLSRSEEDDTEVFDSEQNDLQHGSCQHEKELTDSPAQRSYSVGGRSELRKRFRNWSGTPTNSAGVSPRISRRKKGSPVTFQSLEFVEETRPASDLDSQQMGKRHSDVSCQFFAKRFLLSAGPTTSDRRRRLQAVHSCPSGHVWNSQIGVTCNACQLIRSSLSYGSVSTPKAATVETSKMNANATAPLTLVVPLARNLVVGRNPAGTAKVEAEAEHLRELEGQDYHMMEGIIRRRLHRDSENLDVSLEVNCLLKIIVHSFGTEYFVFSVVNFIY